MLKTKINLKKEQTASMQRPRYNYSLAARIFFSLMDLVTGGKVTLSKVKLIETLASIPYRAWETQQYSRLTRFYKRKEIVERAKKIMEWGREAQDNEYWHLLIINEKMKIDQVKDAWYLKQPIPFLLVCSYILFSRILACFNLSRAFLFNAEFEDHAEHVYAKFVEEHPEWEDQPVDNSMLTGYGEFDNWADVFRRIGLDERDHMNFSFFFFGKHENIVRYEGMPKLPDFN
jgi:ubiquinol oxidase